LNILHLQTNLNLTCGVSKTVYLVAKRGAESHNHFVVALGGDAGKKFSDAGINIKFLNLYYDSPGKNIKIISSVKKIVKEKNIDVIHSHHRLFDFVAYIISFTCKIKRVTSVQSFVYGKKLFSYKSPVLLAAGESVKNHLINYYKIENDRIIVFNNFIDTNEIPEYNNKKTTKKKLGITEDAYVIGYAGRFSVKEKGIDILVNAFRKFNGKNKDSNLVMVGGGEDFKKIDIPENTLTVESKENIFDYYGIFDCLVLPSRVDPFPLAVLEGGMMQVPFIGANVNGIPEIIKDNEDGLLFEKENENMLIEKMYMYYNNRDFARKCAGNLNRKVVEKYNHKKAIELLNKIYEEL
jgi:L-malate glycosyltransferase